MDFHAEGPCPRGDFPSDAAHAEYHDTFALQADTQQLSGTPSCPAAAAHHAVCFVPAAACIQHQHHGYLGASIAKDIRGVQYTDTQFPDYAHIDMVVPDRERCDKAQSGRKASQNVRIDLFGG